VESSKSGDFAQRGKDKTSTLLSKAPQFSRVGNYKFYKEQNKLVKGSTTIALTSKECELISIFSRKPNQIIKWIFW
jgi:DNA-binding response OmpR family regulator